MRSIQVTFPGGSKVDAHFHTFTVHTDQRKSHGGEESAPNPFDYFFVSIATCAGSAVQGFCARNQLPLDGVQVSLHAEQHPTESRYEKITISIVPPPGLDTQQEKALLAAASNCTVKRHILNPPTFDTVIRTDNNATL